MTSTCRNWAEYENTKMRNSIGYILGLLIFVIGIPALMWVVSGRSITYVPDSLTLLVMAIYFAICGLANTTSSGFFVCCLPIICYLCGMFERHSTYADS